MTEPASRRWVLDTQTAPRRRAVAAGPTGTPAGRDARPRDRGLRRPARDWAGDLCCAGGGGLIAALFVVGSLTSEPPEPVYPVVELTVGGAACAALILLRRRWPVGLALALVPAAVSSMVALAMAAMAVFTVALHRPWRVTAAVGGLYAGTVAAVFHLGTEDGRRYWDTVAWVVFLLATLIASGMLVRSQRLLVRSLHDRARQAEEGQHLRIDQARRLERERIAREMHDVLAHRISLLALHAGALEFSPRAGAGEIARAAGVIRACAYEAAEDLREVIGVLRQGDDSGAGGEAGAARPQPALTDLPELVDESRRAGVPVTLDNRLPDLGAVPPAVGRHAYRIVQEGLTNARKHAPGAPVRVTVAGEPGTGLTAEVRNPLPAAPAGAGMPGAGAGLVGLRERVDLVRGRLEHGRTPDGEFRLWAWLGWPR